MLRKKIEKISHYRIIDSYLIDSFDEDLDEFDQWF